MGICLVLGLVLMEGVPPLPPVASKQKLVVGSAAMTGVFFLLDLFSLPRWTDRVLGLLATLGLGIWLGWRRLAPFDSIEPWLLVVTVSLVAFGIGWLLRRRDTKGGSVSAGPLILATALALAAVAGLGGSASLALFSSALAGSIGGLLLVGFVTAQTRAHVPALGSVGSWLSVAFLAGIATSLLYFVPDTSRTALALVAVVPLAGFVADRVPLPEAREALLRPILLFAVGLALVGLAAGVAVWADAQLLVD